MFKWRLLSEDDEGSSKSIRPNPSTFFLKTARDLGESKKYVLGQALTNHQINTRITGVKSSSDNKNALKLKFSKIKCGLMPCPVIVQSTTNKCLVLRSEYQFLNIPQPEL